LGELSNLVALFQIALLGGTLLAPPLLTADSGTKDQDLFNQGKVLMFDKKWDDARAAFQMLLQEFPNSNLVPQANFFSARCLQSQGKDAEALRAYEFFLQKYGQESYLQAEARNAVVDLAAALLEKGDSSYKERITAGLRDGNKEVRYFSAIRSSYLNDRKIATQAVPILREILDKEKERDLVDRAKIALLRIDPNALLAPRESPDQKKSDSGIDSRMFHIMVYEEGKSQPTVELNLPLSWAQLAVMALDQSKKDELKKKGFNVDDFWESLKRLGPTKILEIRDGKDLVKIWIE
jgi:tetratricopeptide (TPR) repeat protein